VHTFKRILALVLAGGRGDGLSILGQLRTVPAVPFAGKYRVIDFALSNLVNSGIHDVAVLTQYRPHSLNDHIGNGKPWDLDRLHGGIKILQPYARFQEIDWFKGTADAVYQNLRMVRESKADIVLVLGADHVYKMDFNALIEFHSAKEADLTVASLEIPGVDPRRFGMMEIDGDRRVGQFVEKPRSFPSTTASMGVYAFNREKLIERIEEDARRHTPHDFGSNILPRMVDSDRVYSYPFHGYWRDVGYLPAYYAANMDQLADVPDLDLYDSAWRIHTRSEERAPARFELGASVEQSLVCHGCIIHGRVERSILSPGVVVAPGAVVRDSIVMTDTRIEADAAVDRCVLDKQIVVGRRARVGHGDDYRPNSQEPELLSSGLTVVGKRTTIPPGATVGRNCKIDAELDPELFPDHSIESGDVVENRAAVSLVRRYRV
jgi:glucose-1-phosphate adenylyltransferase